MPIVYVHGVRVRDPDHAQAVIPSLRRWVAPHVNPENPAAVQIIDAFWGDVGVNWRWGKKSRPSTLLLDMGTAGSSVSEFGGAAEVEGALDTVPRPQGPGPVLGTGGIVGADAEDLRFASLPAGERADLLALLTAARAPRPLTAAEQGELPLAAARVAGDPAAPTGATEIETAALQVQAVWDEITDGELVSMGAGLAERVREFLERAAGAPGSVVSKILGEFRPLLHDFASDFLGDVIEYIEARGTREKPGAIMQRVLTALRKAAPAARTEPLVILTHSMGGQLIYDALTHFVEGDPELENLKVAFWGAAASQVPFFEEAKFFLASDPAIGAPSKAPMPHRVKAWWNVWDVNDVFSFTAKAIFEGVNDEGYDTGFGLLLSHTGYFKRPSFFALLEKRLEAALP
jgi:hypothetical protein